MLKMHELSITKKLIEMIEKEAKQNKIKTITSVTVELGSLTSYKKEPLSFYFDALKKESALIKKTKLIVNEIKGRLKCESCGEESTIEEPYMIFCPECESYNVGIVKGKDFKILNISGK
ncbi:hydrogenase maturation nickel metallochaperone HypA [Candidatus Woesearchaeota archaeon]|nr:hydrogenase maturation nickel metallochaperone HypA [Candidatus Woesearchaeota archaeon]